MTDKILMNGNKELKVVDSAKDYTLLEQVGKDQFIVAWHMDTKGDTCTWASGTYFGSGSYCKNCEDAYDYFYNSIK